MNTITPKCIVALTDERGQFRHSVDAAIGLARAYDARLILYDSSAASTFNEPISSAWSAEGVGDDVGLLLGERQLDRYGRGSIADQVSEARSEGVAAYGWLPSDHGMDAFMEYAARVHADTAVLPAGLDEPGLLDRIRGDTLEDAESSATVAILIAEHDGTVHPARGTELADDEDHVDGRVDETSVESFPASDPPPY